MSEIAEPKRAASPLAQVPALGHAPLGRAGAALTMRALPEGHVLQALTPRGVSNISERLAGIGDASPFAVRPLAPGQWFIVGDAVLSHAEFNEKATAITDLAALSDQSSGRVRIALTGPAAETVLSRGTGLDLAPAAFPIGQSAQTLFGHIGVHLTRTAKDAFELMVLRSFSQSLWEELEGLGRVYFGGV